MIEDNTTLINIIRNKSKMYLDNLPRNEKVLEAMLKVDRMQFLPASVRNYAYEDRPVPIGFNQTCSQPSMVAFMLDKLDIKPGNKILEIGAGCGYAAAIACHLCAPDGIIYASEIIVELANFMRANLAQYSERIIVLAEDGSMGFKEYAPFDRILISAGVASNKFDRNILLDQLVDGGILLYPETYGNIFLIKKDKDTFINETYFGVSFVPLRGKNS
jgi:protein-L-isoaspartate(D-aspartate) O-methyltransferase